MGTAIVNPTLTTATETAPAPPPTFRDMLGNEGTFLSDLLSNPMSPAPVVPVVPVASVAPASSEPPAQVAAPATGEAAPETKPAVAETAPPVTEPKHAETAEQIMAALKLQYPEWSDTAIKQVADKEVHIRKQAGHITRLLEHVKERPSSAPVPASGTGDGLTALERQVSVSAPSSTTQAPPVAPPTGQAAGTAPQPALPASQPVPQAQAEPPIWANWRSPADAQADYSQAMADGDFHKAAAIQDTLARAQAYGQQESLRQMVAEVIKTQFGDVLPVSREIAAERMLDEDKSAAIDQLKTAGVDVAPLLEADGVFEHEGRQYPNSQMNRILAQHPDLIKLVVPHADPRMSRQLTFISRFRMVASLAGSKPLAGTAPPAPAAPGTAPAATAAQTAGGKVPSLEEVLREARDFMAQREELDRVRQGMNAGAGATQTTGAPAAQSLVGSLNMTGGSFLDDLLR